MNRIPIKAMPPPVPWIPIKSEKAWQRILMREWALAWRAARHAKPALAFTALHNAITCRNSANTRNSVISFSTHEYAS